MASRKIILVEDDPDDRELFQEFYSGRKDITLLTSFGDGLELIEYLNQVERPEQMPDLIVLDQNMPRMNGKQTLSFMKSHETYASIPAVIYSTYTDTNLVLECTQLGAMMVAVKPIDKPGYQKMMDDFLESL